MNEYSKIQFYIKLISINKELNGQLYIASYIVILTIEMEKVNTEQTVMCNCGNPWNIKCLADGMAKCYYVPDPQKFEACKTPEERRALFSNPSAMIKVDTSHHFPISRFNINL